MMEIWSGDMWNESNGYVFNGNFSAMNQSENFTISCAAENIQGRFQLPYSTILTGQLSALLATYLLAVLVAGGSLNIVVISLIIWLKKFTTFTLGITLLVTTVDFLLLFLVLVRVVSMIAYKWVFGEHMCAVLGALHDIVLTQRLLLMSVFVSNRLLCIFNPQLYPKLRLKLAALFSISSWLLTVIVFITSLGLDCYTFVPTLWSCGMSHDCSDVCAIYNRVIFGFLTPVRIAIAVLFVVIYRKAKRAARNTEANAESHEYYQRELKTTKAFLLFHVIFVMITTPQLIAKFVSDNILNVSELPVALYVVTTVAEAVIPFQVIIDPIIIMRHPDIIKYCSERNKVYGTNDIELSNAGGVAR